MRPGSGPVDEDQMTEFATPVTGAALWRDVLADVKGVAVAKTCKMRKPLRTL